MDRFYAENLYTTKSFPKWKKIIYLVFAIIFTIGSFSLALFYKRDLLFLYFIVIFLFCFFSGKKCSCSLPDILPDCNFKNFDFYEYEEHRGFSFSFLGPDNFISAAKYVENLKFDYEKDAAKKQISFFIDFLNKTNNFSISLCDSNKIAKYGTTDERRMISIDLKIFFVFILSFSLVLVEFLRDNLFYPWYHYALCFIVYFFGQFFWFRFGKYRSQTVYVSNDEYKNLTDKIIAKDVIENYITNPCSSLYYPTDRYDVYATYSQLDFSKIVEIFSLNEKDIDFLCKRLIEIDYLRLKEQVRKESFYPEYVIFTNFLFHNCIVLNIFMIATLSV